MPRVLNPLAVLEWNTDKQRYLTDLAAAGVPVVPTASSRPGEALEPPGGPFVVKPAISAGGRQLGAVRAPARTTRRASSSREIHADGRTAMVQPYLGDADETALVYIDGAYSHALRRRVPLPPRASVRSSTSTRSSARHRRREQERAVAEAALACVPGPTALRPRRPVGGVVLELEVVEPSLYLAFGDRRRRASAFAAAQIVPTSDRRHARAMRWLQ